jgi:hypothetical protein
MIWAYRAVFWIPFLTAIIILADLWWLKVLKDKIPSRSVKLAAVLALGIFVLQFVAKSLFFYFLTRADEFGRYLLKQPGYLKNNLVVIAQPYFGALLVAVIFTLLGILVFKLSKRPIFEKVDLWVLFTATFITGYPGALLAVLGALIIMIGVQITQLIRHKPHGRLDLIPFLLGTTIAVGILSSFGFYINFLQNLGLI